MAPRNIGNVDQTYVLNVFLQLFNEVSLRNLLMEKIVEKLHLRVIDGFDDLEPTVDRSQEVMRVFFRINILEQHAYRSAVDSLPFHKRYRSLEPVNAALVLGLDCHSRHHVSRKKNHGRTVKPLHDGNCAAELGYQCVSLCRTA